MRLVLDTNAYVALRRGEEGILDLVESADFLGLPPVVLGELYAGFLIGDRASRNIQELEDFLAEGGIEILGMGRREAERYGALVKALRELGKPIPTNDLWIAACTLCSDSWLLTEDAHFRSVPGLLPIGWRNMGSKTMANPPGTPYTLHS